MNVICTCENNTELEGPSLILTFCDILSPFPILSQYDIDVIKTLGVQHKVDYISLSFCRNANDIIECRKLLDKYIIIINIYIIKKILKLWIKENKYHCKN